MARSSQKEPKSATQAKAYGHPEAEALLRPEVGTQAQFRKKKEPRRYRLDSSLAPELACDGQSAARELGEWLIACIEAAAKLPAPHAFPSPRTMKRPEGAEARDRPATLPVSAPVRAGGRPGVASAGCGR